MVEALALAARVPRRPWPNPPVGALVVADDGEVLGRGAHHGPGTAHAEVTALNEAGPRARGATLYCTLEPCNHHGRTAPCAPRVAASGVAPPRSRRPRSEPARRGRRPGTAAAVGSRRHGGRCRRRGARVDLAVCAYASIRASLRAPEDGDVARRPLRAGHQAGGTGPFYLTGIEARRDVHRLRRWADLVLVGAGTVVAIDRPTRRPPGGCRCGVSARRPAARLRRHGPRRRHLLVGAPHLAACGRSAPPDRTQVVEASGGTRDSVRRARRTRGPRLAARAAGGSRAARRARGGWPDARPGFLARGLVDRWVCFIAPVVLGAGAGLAAGLSRRGERVPPPVRLTRCEAVGPDARLVYDAVSFDDTLRRLDRVAGGVRCSPGSFGRSARIETIARRSSITRLEVSGDPTAPTLAVGDSLAVDGICLTVTRRAAASVEVEATQETRRVTTLGRWPAGDRRAPRAGAPRRRPDRRPLRPRPRGRRRAGGTIERRGRRRVLRVAAPGAARGNSCPRVDRSGRRQPDTRRGALSRVVFDHARAPHARGDAPREARSRRRGEPRARRPGEDGRARGDGINQPGAAAAGRRRWRRCWRAAGRGGPTVTGDTP